MPPVIIAHRTSPRDAPENSLEGIRRSAELGADYAVFRNGRLTVGPLLLGADDVREIRESVASAVYTNDKRELAMRSDGFRGGLPALAAILDVRRAA